METRNLYVKRSRNKLTKKQLKELRSHRFVLYERSYNNVMKRLIFCKAMINTYSGSPNIKEGIFCYSYERVRRLYDFMHNEFIEELKNIGIVPDNVNFYIFDKKARDFKLSI